MKVFNSPTLPSPGPTFESVVKTLVKDVSISIPNTEIKTEPNINVIIKIK